MPRNYVRRSKEEVRAALRVRYRTDTEYRARILAYGRKRADDREAQGLSRYSLTPEKKEKNRIWMQRHPEKRRAYWHRGHEKQRLRDLGVSAQDIKLMCIQQGNRCAICYRLFDQTMGQKAARPQVDHDHVSGRARGVLCMLCNVALGNFGDKEEVLLRAVDYLRKYQAQESP